MRIISGKFKGKKISYTNSIITRPLRDSVRENIFNIIAHGKNTKLSLENTNILDLYSGVGSFGIECLSRNLCHVVFVEKDPLAFSILEKNINKLKIMNNAQLIPEDIKSYIKKLNVRDKFDLIFLDPPFKDTSYIEIIALIKKKGIFNKHHRVIIHRERNSNEELNKLLKIDLQRDYGRSKIIFGCF